MMRSAAGSDQPRQPNMKLNMQDRVTDETWIDNLIEPLRTAADAPLFMTPKEEPSEEYLARCRNTAMQAWSLHRLKAEVRNAPVEMLGLTLWLRRLAARAGLELAAAAAAFMDHPAADLKNWPAAALGRFLRTLGVDPAQARVQIGLDWLFGAEADEAALAVAFRGATGGGSRPPDLQAADEALTRECLARPAAEQAAFRQYLGGLMAAMTAPGD